MSASRARNEKLERIWLDKDGQVKGTQDKVKEREKALNQAWCVRLLHHCSGCGSLVERRYQRCGPAG